MILPIIFAMTVPVAQLTGGWKYVAYEYDGQTHAVSSGVDLRFHFESNGKAKIRWHYEDVENFCERLSEFKIVENNWIYQKVTWVNPENHSSCASDPDMKMDKESFTRFKFKAERLLLIMDLGDKQFIYILEKENL